MNFQLFEGLVHPLANRVNKDLLEVETVLWTLEVGIKLVEPL